MAMDNSINFEERPNTDASSNAPASTTTKLSYTSLAIPAQSPTLSPTLSAMTPGFLGSSSGIPASTLPTMSAPQSAAFVYMPPATLMNSDIRLAPKATGARVSAHRGVGSIG